MELWKVFETNCKGEKVELETFSSFAELEKYFTREFGYRRMGLTEFVHYYLESISGDEKLDSILDVDVVKKWLENVTLYDAKFEKLFSDFITFGAFYLEMFNGRSGESRSLLIRSDEFDEPGGSLEVAFNELLEVFGNVNTPRGVVPTFFVICKKV